MIEVSSTPSDSLYDEVMSDPDAEHAFRNTTEGVLTGRPDDDDLRRAKEELDACGIAYLYNPDPARPRPMFLTRERTIAGLQQIQDYIESVHPAISS